MLGLLVHIIGKFLEYFGNIQIFIYFFLNSKFTFNFSPIKFCEYNHLMK